MEGKPETSVRTARVRAVTLRCVVCSGRTTIHVERKRTLPGTVLWECFDCQKADKGSVGRKGAALKTVKAQQGRVIAGDENL